MSAVPDEETLGKLRRVVESFGSEEYDGAAQLCRELLLVSPSDDGGDAWQQNNDGCLREILVHALIERQQYDGAVVVLDSAAAAAPAALEEELTASDRRLLALRSYASYRQRNYVHAKYLLVSGGRTSGTDWAPTEYKLCLLAQALHHQLDAANAVRLYADLLSVCACDEERVQLWTNVLAVWIATAATPYTAAASTTLTTPTTTTPRRAADENHVVTTAVAVAAVEAMVDTVSSYLSTRSVNDDEQAYPYDLAYNLATLRLTTTVKAADRAPWLRLLDTAAAGARRSAAAAAAGEIGPIATNRAVFGRAFWNLSARRSGSGVTVLDTAASTNSAANSATTTALQAVRDVNNALGQSPEAALKVLGREPDETKMTVQQMRIWHYNRAVTLLQVGRYDECRATCLRFAAAAPKKGNKKKSKAAEDAAAFLASAVYNSPVNTIFWESRAAVLLAHCAAATAAAESDGLAERPSAILDACLERCRALPASDARDHLATYLILHRATFADAGHGAAAQIELLRHGLPESVRGKPGVVATLAALYQSMGDDAMATQLLDTVNDEHAIADFAMARGNYEQAALLYETAAAGSNDPATKARWVRALSHTDPEKAIQLWSDMAPDLVVEGDGDGDANGAELEAKELRLKSTLVRRGGTEPVGDGGRGDNNNKKKTKGKSRAAVLRRRARLRDAYLAEQEIKAAAAGHPTKPGVGGAGGPDPERWWPKFERSNARRRRKNHRGPPPSQSQHHKGAQGGVSETDAAKLDIVARQAAAAEPPSSSAASSAGRSTAHMAVSGGASRGKGKGGKRR